MNRKPRTVYFRRKREGKTNYKKRLALLRSGSTRLVVRRTNKHTIAQLVDFNVNGDKIIAHATSEHLKKLGWKHSGKNLPSAYLTGLLLGSKAGKTKEVVVDFGLRPPVKRSRLFACIKGARDAGLNVKAAEDVFPQDNRLNGAHISDTVQKDADALKQKILK